MSGGGEDGGGLEWQAGAVSPATGRDAGALADAGEDRVERDDYGETRAGRYCRREFVLSVDAASVCDGEFISAEKDRGAAAGDFVCVRAFAGEEGECFLRQQDGLSASWGVVREKWLRLPRARFASVGRDRGDSSRAVSREDVVVDVARIHAGRRR